MEPSVSIFIGMGPEWHKAKLHNIPADHVHMIAYVDFNIPMASTKNRITDLSKAVHMVLQSNGVRTVGVLDYPDVPKPSSKRGLADEESDIQTAFWSLKMCLDTRFITAYEFPPSADAFSKKRTDDGRPLIL